MTGKVSHELLLFYDNGQQTNFSDNHFVAICRFWLYIVNTTVFFGFVRVAVFGLVCFYGFLYHLVVFVCGHDGEFFEVSEFSNSEVMWIGSNVSNLVELASCAVS